MDVGERANGGQVLGRAAQDLLELDRRRVELAHLHQGAAQRDAGETYTRVPQQARSTRFDRFGEQAETPVILGQRGEGNRRRVPWTRRFSSSTRGVSVITAIGGSRRIATGTDTGRVLPALSVTASVT